MRIAALYDIHGNLPALEAVLREVRELAVDQIVIGGDVIPGPLPRETIVTLQTLDIPTICIRGNGEREVLALLDGETTQIPDTRTETMNWVGGLLDPQHRELLGNWPLTIELNIPGTGIVLFCHATPRSDAEIFTCQTPEDRLLPIFGNTDASLVVCGHTHMPFDRMIGDVRVVNAGSVGMPFGGTGADWLLLGPDIELRHTDYDLAAAATRISATEYPQAEQFVADHLLASPSRAKMLELFEKAALS